ncbi:MAG: ATP-binding protein [Lachnospiraceae bacterium]|nr:ATP-binding protein [Lachnospiraceae bacterium]
MFVGRNRELNKLNTLYQSGQFEFAVFYGRRRVGKTTLLREFMREKKGIYYMAVEGTGRENLSGLSAALFTQNHLMAYQAAFGDYEGLLEYIDALATAGERLVIAIDEYPYLAASYPAISSMLQKHIDQIWKDSRLFLILCGSSMSFMEEQVLGYKSPLYGRRTAQFKIQPFTFWEAKEMLADFTIWEQAALYGVTGGIPEYLSRIKTSVGADENIIELFFDESGRLLEEPLNLMKQELREPMSYHSIISAIASGASRLNEIATKTGLETSGCSNQLSSLISLQIIKKETPMTEPVSSRRTLYRLEDSMYLFWYRFVRPNSSSIMRGVGRQVYEAIVLPQMNDFMGAIFERICQQYLFLPEIYSSLPFVIGEVGRWWGTNAREKRQEEIDLMAVTEKQALFGECKWKNEKIGRQVVERLFERGELFHYPEKYYYLFSKAGFQEEARLFAQKNKRIYLLSFEEMCTQTAGSHIR